MERLNGGFILLDLSYIDLIDGNNHVSEIKQEQLKIIDKISSSKYEKPILLKHKFGTELRYAILNLNTQNSTFTYNTLLLSIENYQISLG